MTDKITVFIKELKDRGYILGHTRYKRKTQVTIKFGLVGATKEQRAKNAKKICKLADKFFGRRVFGCLFCFERLSGSLDRRWILEIYITNKGQRTKRKDDRIFHIFNSKIGEDRYESI